MLFKKASILWFVLIFFQGMPLAFGNPESVLATSQLIKSFDQPSEYISEKRDPFIETTQEENDVPINKESISVVVKNFLLDGKPLGKSERKITKPFLGRKLTFEQLEEIANKLTSFYRKKGKILTKVIIPAQEFKANVVNFHLVQGYISKVIIEGDKTLLNERINDCVKRILQDQPLTWSVYEREILLINDLPGIDAKTTIVNGSESSGATHLILELKKTDMHLFADVNNSGTKTLGPWQ